MLFDPKSFDTTVEVIDVYEGGYPKRLALPSQRLEFDVSPGGVVEITNIQHAFLFAHDGITQVEFQPKLTPEFLDAARNPDAQMIDFVMYAKHLISDFLNTSHFPTTSVRDSLVEKFGELAVECPILLPITNIFDEQVLFVRSFLQAFKIPDKERVEYFFRDVNAAPEEMFFHFDRGNRGRALFNIAGKTTWTVDARVTEAEAAALIDKGRREAISSQMLRYPIRKAKHGSISFVRGSGILDSESCIEQAIRDLSVHASPQDFVQGEDARLFFVMN